MRWTSFLALPGLVSIALAGGTVEGTVTYNGEPPALPPRPVTQDKEACGLGDSVPDDSLVVDKATRGLSDAVVFLEPKDKKAEAAGQGKTVLFDQEHCLFTDRVLVVPEKAKVEFANSDKVAHNVNLKAVKNTGFNKTIAGGEKVDWIAEREERIPVECNVHPWMKGWLVVTDAPYHAVTDDKGHFKIENVPAGEYKVKVWHERLSSKKCWEGPATVTVKDGAVAEVNFKGTPKD